VALRQDRRTLGAAKVEENEAAIAAAVRKVKQAARTTKLVATKGNYAETVEVSEPHSDDEGNPPKKTLKKNPKEVKEAEEEPQVHVVQRQATPQPSQAEKFDMQKSLNEMMQQQRMMMEAMAKRMEVIEKERAGTALPPVQQSQPTEAEDANRRRGWSYRGRGGFRGGRGRWQDRQDRRDRQPPQQSLTEVPTGGDKIQQVLQYLQQMAAQPQQQAQQTQLQYSPQPTAAAVQQAQQPTLPQLTYVPPQANVLAVQPQSSQQPQLTYNLSQQAAYQQQPRRVQTACRFRPCMDEKCIKIHEPGQFVPNKKELELKTAYSIKKRCRRQHDGNCADGERCLRAHGKDTPSNPQRCEMMKIGMCAPFFEDKCLKSHQL
jgi:hypothetical protein